MALGIFNLAEHKLLENKFEESIFYIRNCTFDLKDDLLLKQVYNNKLTIEKWDERFNHELKSTKKTSIEI